MPTIRIKRNPNFRHFWNITDTETQNVTEVEGRTTAVKIAMRMAVKIGERKFIEETKQGFELRHVT